MRLGGYLVFSAGLLLLLLCLCLIAVCVAFAVWAHDSEPLRIASSLIYPLVVAILCLYVGNVLIETNSR